MIIHAEASSTERKKKRSLPPFWRPSQNARLFIFPKRRQRSFFLMAFASFLRGIPLFFAARPKTPLRVLCVMAFDTLHVLDHAQRLPRTKLNVLSALLDFGACANAEFDDKSFCRDEFRRTRQFLDDAGAASAVNEYLKRLRALEKQRPGTGGDQGHFRRVRLYRESIVRLSLAMVAVLANGRHCIGEEIQATYSDENLAILFRIVMQCQIIDDVLDYSHDLSAELPSFLTASASLPLAFELTRLVTQEYARERDKGRASAILPLRLALLGVSVCAKLAVVIGRSVRCAREAAVSEVACVPGRAMCEPPGVYLD